MIKQKSYIRPYAHGFTLIELLVALAIAGILISYGLPSYNRFAQRQTLSTETNNFLSDINFARNLAVDKGTSVSLISNNGSDWEGGWIIVQNLPTNPVTTQTVRVKQQLPGGVTITENGGLDRVTYDSQGGALTLMNFTIQKTPDFPNFIALTVSPSGLASSNRTH
jgi:type IV fimbrial biogenesis protein FimT